MEEKRAQSSPLSTCANFLATGFYSGLCPKAPGTAGTVVAMLLVFVAHWTYPQATLQIILPLAIATTLLGILSANYLCRIGFYGESKDPKQIVIDEFAGYFVALIGLDLSPTILVLAFFWFRVFDILKPPPVSTAEKLPLGYGIVLDDVVAGIYAAFAVRITLLIIGG